MSERTSFDPIRTWGAVSSALLLGLAALVPGTGRGLADEPKSAAKSREVVARAALGALLYRRGAAQVRVRFRDQVWDLTLSEPKSRLAFELYGRWPRGVPFNKEDKDEQPTADVVLLALQGDVEVKAGGRIFAMHAPPGPAIFHW